MYGEILLEEGRKEGRESEGEEREREKRGKREIDKGRGGREDGIQNRYIINTFFQGEPL